uniref:ubiquitinyl hydrolase 1 n=1 Tax=Neogobius melanostomus TaxID=47308 RepID=A0A8C6TT46_9GOBI
LAVKAAACSRGAEKHMDEYLRSIGLHRKKIAKDGSCLFRAVAEQVLHCQSFHIQVRAQCVEYLRQNRENYEAFIEGDFEDYLYKLRDPQQWVGEVEINALAMMYKRDFWIFQEPGKAAVNITDKNFKDRLCFLNGNHYDCVYPINRVKNTAVCQSILYELLYDSVCHVDRNLLGVCHRNPKPSDVLIDDCLGRGRGRFMSERVRRSLNPTLLRNVQFDLWLKSKKAQQKMDFCIAAGMQYSVGDRCQVCVLHSFTVLHKPKAFININICFVSEWEDRGRGRGRGKPTPAPSGVPQATAPPGGRISKQHSWPPQANADEREAPTTSPSLSSTSRHLICYCKTRSQTKSKTKSRPLSHSPRLPLLLRSAPPLPKSSLSLKLNQSTFPSLKSPSPLLPPRPPFTHRPSPKRVPCPSRAPQSSAPSQPHMEHPNSAPNPNPDLPVPPSPEQPAPQQLQYPFPLHQQLSLYYQDPLYPGFPLGDKGQVVPVPPMSTSQSGDDLPLDMNVLRFFFNLGVKVNNRLIILYYTVGENVHLTQSPCPPDPCHPATPYEEANLQDQASSNAFNPAHSTPQAPLAAQNPPHSTQAPPQSVYSPAHSTQAPPQSVYSPAHSTQAPPQSVYSPAHSTQAPPQSVYSPAHSTQAPPQSVYSPAHSTQAPPQSVYNPAHNTQAPPLSVYSPAHNTQAPLSVYSPAHNTHAPPHSAYNPDHNTQAHQSVYSPTHNTQAHPQSVYSPAHNTQTPPTAYNAANSEAPPSSYTRSTPQQIPPTAFDTALPNPQPPPSAYSPSRPSQPTASDAPCPQSYPQHVQWQQSQAYGVNYPYSQVYYHHQQPQPANGDTPPGLRASRLPAALEGSASANAGNVNGGQMQMLPGVTGFGTWNDSCLF